MTASGLVPALQVPTPDFPVIGDQAPIAILFLAHMAIVQFSLGVITLGPIFEWLGHRDGDVRKFRLARILTRAYYLSFSIGATLGVFAITVLIGLWGYEFGTLVNRFLLLVAVAFGIFPLLVPPLVLYHTRFGRMAPRRHMALGVYIWAMQTLFMVCIVGIDAYLTTPDHTGFLDATRNALYWPLLVHRFVGNISWAALFVAGIAVLRLRAARSEADIAFHAWAAHRCLRIGAALLVVQPVLGAVLMVVLHDHVPGYFFSLVQGSTAWLFVVQGALLGAVVVGVNLALQWEGPDGNSRAALGGPLTAAAVAGSVVGLLPSSVLGPGIYGLRYVGIAVAMLATAVHLALRTVPRTARALPRLAPGAVAQQPYAAARARWLVTGVGVTAAVLSLWMGFMKSEARGADAIYGEMTLSQAHGPYQPSGIYP